MLNTVQFSPETIIWSADVPRADIEKVIEEQALPEGTVIKLDRLFFENESKDFIDYCQDRGYPVFCDAKIIEIPDKTMKIAETYLEYRPFMLNVMAGICSTGNYSENVDEKQRDALARFADACLDAGTLSCAVTVLTSKNNETCRNEFNIDSPLEQVMNYVGMLDEAGITDVVCSPKEAGEINKWYYRRFSINTPGVRLPGSSKDDQQRVTTPHDALENGASRLVIGRDLIRGKGDIAERVKHNYERIVQNIFEG